MEIGAYNNSFINSLCDEYTKYNRIDIELYKKHNVKRGLRNADGTGVVAGLTNICNVHGYLVNEGERMAVDGELIYRGINIKAIAKAGKAEGRFIFEETIYLLLFGYLPNAKQLEDFCNLLSECRELPENFTEDMIMKAPSPDIMNKLSRSVLALYSYDDTPDDCAVANVLRQCIELISRFPAIVVAAYQVKRRHYDKKSMYFHFPQENLSVAQNFLYTMRKNKNFTDDEAKVLDLCLMLHAEHGGGNNSTFTSRVLTSSGTDTYAAISSAVSSLKGPKHGGASNKVSEMFEYIKKAVDDPRDDNKILAYLEQILQKQAGDKSGLIYGLGHAVYTVSDPRAVILKDYARSMAEKRGLTNEFLLIDAIERLGPVAFKKVKGTDQLICANVDMYSGFVYSMLGIPAELYTPLFAMARIVGWSAHRIEELTNEGKIIRPAYKNIKANNDYIPLCKR